MGTDFRERVGLAVGERDAADVSQVRKRGHKTQRTADVSQEKKKTRSWEPAGEGGEGRGSGTEAKASTRSAVRINAFPLVRKGRRIEPAQYQ